MARLGDVPVVFKRIGGWTLAKRVWQQVGEDDVFTWGAALAYAWLFAIFPFLVFLLSLVPLVPERYKNNVDDRVVNFVYELLPEDVGTKIIEQVRSVLQNNAGGFLSFGLLVTIWAASGGMAMTMSALDKAYDIEKVRPYFKKRLLAISMTIVVATLVILVTILMPVASGVLNWLDLPAWLKVLADVVRYAFAIVLMFTVLAIIYHFGPSFKQKFVAITPGAVFCVAIWLLLGGIFRVYLTTFHGAANYIRVYGAVAGAVILLLFFYLDALVLLVGAELNSEVDFALYGQRGVAPPADASPVPQPPDSVKPS